jgi:hypothetical protein
MRKPGAPASDAATFYDSLRECLDVGRPLLWYFLLEGITEDRAEPIVRALTEQGFTDIEGLFDEEREGLLIIEFGERRVHSRASFVERVDGLLEFAEENGVKLLDYSAGNV